AHPFQVTFASAIIFHPSPSPSNLTLDLFLGPPSSEVAGVSLFFPVISALPHVSLPSQENEDSGPQRKAPFNDPHGHDLDVRQEVHGEQQQEQGQQDHPDIAGHDVTPFESRK